MPTTFQAERLVRHCGILMRMAEALGLPVIVTEQNPRGLGATVPALKALMGESKAIEKTQFSAFVPEVRQQLDTANRSHVLICGIEAHVCVMQTVLDMHAAGVETFLLSDAVSAGQPDQIAWAIQRMQRAGCVVTGIVSAMYELMQNSTHPAFRTCLGLAKEATAGAPTAAARG